MDEQGLSRCDRDSQRRCEMIVEYTLAKECKNEEVWYTCYQCGKCGRVFEDGFMVDDGGTTIDEEE